jgi:hypothetical protein
VSSHRPADDSWAGSRESRPPHVQAQRHRPATTFPGLRLRPRETLREFLHHRRYGVFDAGKTHHKISHMCTVDSPHRVVGSRRPQVAERTITPLSALLEKQSAQQTHWCQFRGRGFCRSHPISNQRAARASALTNAQRTKPHGHPGHRSVQLRCSCIVQRLCKPFQNCFRY